MPDSLIIDDGEYSKIILEPGFWRNVSRPNKGALLTEVLQRKANKVAGVAQAPAIVRAVRGEPLGRCAHVARLGIALHVGSSFCASCLVAIQVLNWAVDTYGWDTEAEAAKVAKKAGVAG